MLEHAIAPLERREHDQREALELEAGGGRAGQVPKVCFRPEVVPVRPGLGRVVEYKPDFRQKIAETWPQRLDDSLAQRDWGWRSEYDLDAMTRDMLRELRARMEPSEGLHPEGL